MTNKIEYDEINKPKHYLGEKFEVIDIIEDFHLNYNLGNAVKYLFRAGKKTETSLLTDLRKAIWYINREISIIERINK